ncbi:nucleotidyl transferase AbiEii/AbiGii toxin family protein [Streptomyces sp. NPDC017979]|uniref:nucleotidyl transferase AbiEii/AbiGii toxin family protein n=1 Tax=Streptomyces sp. NPDC017979 TaxID=3365024 RepID=UPI0037AFF4A5
MGAVSGAWGGGQFAGLGALDRQRIDVVAAVLDGVGRVLPAQGWHLKGSAALLGWLGPAARLPNDVDLCLASGMAPRLLSPVALPRAQGGACVRLLRAEPIVFSSPDRATAHRVLAEVADRPGGVVVGRVLLNVLLVPDVRAAADARTAPLHFPSSAGAVTVPAGTLSRLVAQKLLRYTRLRDGKVNTRWADLMDVLLVAASHRAPALHLGELRHDIAVEFTEMRRPWPARLPAPPAEWLDFWDNATFLHALPFGRLPDAVGQLERFLLPVLEGSEQPAPARAWSPGAWEWAIRE